MTTTREYLRVSLDRSGRQRSQAEQHEDNQRAAAEHGLTLGAPYTDTGSASRYAAKGRDGFASLLGDLGSGRFGAEVLMLWESSRGSRRVGEWVDLIETCEERGVKIHVTTHGRTYDTANGRDRRSLLEDAVDSEYESAKLSARGRRAAAANAAAGRPNGPTPYGFERRFDPQTRKLAGQFEHPDEGPRVRELFERIERGDSLHGIARDWAAQGVVNGKGAPFSPQHLRSMATCPAYGGLRASTRNGVRITVTATWQPLVPLARWHAVQRILTDPKRITRRPGRAVHLLSMIARCAVCDAVLAVSFRKGTAFYSCHGIGCVSVARDDLDEVITGAVLAYLSRPDVHRMLISAETDTEELSRVRDEVAAVRGELDALAVEVGAGRLSATLAAAAEPAILARLNAAEQREQALITPAALAGILAPGEDVATRWEAASMPARREVMRMMLSDELLGVVRIGPSPTLGVRCPVARRIVNWPRS